MKENYIFPQVFVVVAALLSVASGGNVLLMHPMYAASHVLALRTLTKELTTRGHQVTVVRWRDSHSYSPLDDPNITEYVLAINNTHGNVPHVSQEERGRFIMPQEQMWSNGLSITSVPVDMFQTISAFCKALFSQEDLIKTLRAQKFDIAIIDLIYNECSLALAHDMGAPYIGYWAFTFTSGEALYTTAYSPPSVVPVILSHLTTPMGYTSRLINHVMALAGHIVMAVQFAITGYHIREHLPSSPGPSQLLWNMSGMLINVHPALETPCLLPPAFLEVGGFHIKERKPLPQDLEHFLEGSGEEGTILFSMGFIFNSEVVPKSTIEAYMRAFGKLQQKVLMKFDGPVDNVPSNVKMVQWLPQQDILGHRRTVLFMTHCGMHGVMEALHYGVPMVGIPIFADQKDVLQRLLEKGLAIGLDKTADSQQIYEAIQEVLIDNRYKERVSAFSGILHHQISSPLNKAVWLVEHIMNTSGADHLKLPVQHLNFVQFYGMDVILLLIVLSYLLIRYLIPEISKLFIRLIRSNSNKVKVS
ncbi:unnamed protein product [Meganyctiphanes norvegica]|uniref:UDP-glucuronosyltransferase n=1 Tax=Meganyctiphanes norvegica TaxID=48144 RepID=A0AAV2RIW7_MEGNR